MPYKLIVNQPKLQIYLVKSNEKRKDSETFLKDVLGFETIKTNYKRPVLKNSSKFFSKTYFDEGFLLLVSSFDITIDAENMKNIDNGVKAFLCEAGSDLEFLKVFTKKEALIKLHNLALKNISDQLEGFSYTFYYDDLVISLASFEDISLLLEKI